jgi:hypothetical protein
MIRFREFRSTGREQTENKYHYKHSHPFNPMYVHDYNCGHKIDGSKGNLLDIETLREPMPLRKYIVQRLWVWVPVRQ